MNIDKYENRKQAGEILASQLTKYTNTENVFIFALPRGGVPVAFEISKKLQLPLDVFLVRKLGVPGHEELAMGAIAVDGSIFMNQDTLNMLNISKASIEMVIQKETQELARRNLLYRKNKKLPHLNDKTILLVDDGIATGATVKAAISALKNKVAKIILVTPVMAQSTYDELVHWVDEIVCPLTPTHFYAVGFWYDEFLQTSDEEVCELLKAATHFHK